MAAEPKAVTEDAKIDLFEDDDEFEEFEINEGNKFFYFLFYFILLVVDADCIFNNFNSEIC